MARGKYSAKAANRLARLDNDLLQEKLAEIDSLKRQLAISDAARNSERAERDAIITSRADALSQRLVASARADALRVQEETETEKRALADWLVAYFNDIQKRNPDVRVIPLDIAERIAALVGAADTGEYVARIAGMQTSRKHRRRSSHDITADAVDNRRADWARGTAHAGYLEPIQ